LPYIHQEREDTISVQDRRKTQPPCQCREAGHGETNTVTEGKQRKESLQDIILISGACVALFGLLCVTDANLFETMAKWLERYEPWQLDELVVVIVFLALALAVFSLRRWKELRQEIALRNRFQAELFKVNGELETRVKERTEGLLESRKRIAEQLKEREVLLREIHHRVKNNLAVIISLLELRSHYAEDQATQEAFKEMQDRIRSMALAHEMLYHSESLADVDISQYVETLLDHIVSSIGTITNPIDLRNEVKDFCFNIDTAISLGFLLTELVSNCVKHAFPDRADGQIRVSLESVAKEEFEMSVADNGIGMPEDIDLENPPSLGLNLVMVFVEQLHGEIEFLPKNGTEVQVRFKGVETRPRFDLP
jgi:two-component sensor histidine kinase